MPPKESRQGCAGAREGPGPGGPQQSPLHSRPLPVTLQSPLRSLNPSLLRLRRLDRKLYRDPRASPDLQPKLARPGRLDLSRKPSARPRSWLSREMPSLCAATRTRRGSASYSKGLLVPGPPARGLERQRAFGRRRLLTSAGGRGCEAPSAPPLFGSWRKVNRVLGPHSD